MSDLFHKDVPVEYIERVFDVMHRANWHQYQILTKRSARLREVGPELLWEPHMWMGVSVESGDYLSRIDDLRTTGAQVKWLSLEPLLGPLPNLDLRGIGWVVVGGESGPGARPMNLDWVRSIRDQCLGEGVAFFLKQLGGYPDKRGKEKAVLDGRRWAEYPTGEVQLKTGRTITDKEKTT
jgi:protein gp37